ncbi:hypothetical protein IVB24_13300 [Bradyrhizobium sp. 192]|nr:hypothetical protein IVB24_13300 [Bradyrhizobium sp. 192]
MDILPVLGFAGVEAVASQEDYDAVEFCEQHIPLLARVNARYRAAGWGSLGNNPSITALENTILSDREVICDVFHKTPNIGGHVLLLIGFDRNRQVFFAKNHWGEGKFIEIAYNNDPNWQINSGWYITDVVDPTFVQSEACWLGNWHANVGNSSFRLILRRSEDFANPGTPTKLGTAAARMHTVEITINVELQERGRMIRRPTCAGRLNATEPKFSQIEGRNEGVDHANRIVIQNPVIQAFRQQSRLPAISPLNEATHAQPPPIQCGNHSRQGVFTQPGSKAGVDAGLAWCSVYLRQRTPRRLRLFS